MMNASPNQQRQHDGVAVMRCYRPTRIERELLAQVFDIVQRPSAGDSTNTTFDSMRGPVVSAGEASSLPSERRDSGSLEQQPRELEPAA